MTIHFPKSGERKLRVGVVYGGQSVEHEISILSAKHVIHALDRSRFDPVPIGINRQGRWLRQSERALLEAGNDPSRAMLTSGVPVNLYKLSASDLENTSPGPSPFDTCLRSVGVDVVFSVMHGSKGEDGAIQGMMEMAGIPYVGAGVLGSAIGMDKDVTKRLLIEAGIPVARFMAVRKREFERHPLTVCRKVACLGFPLFAKPASLGSSVGVSKVSSIQQLREALAFALQFDEKAIVEEAIAGRELECAILDGDEPKASVVGEVVIKSADGFYSYDAKYVDENSAVLKVPANVDRVIAKRAQRLAVRAFEVLECEGLARVDFFLTPRNQLLVNEINTLPGFTARSMYPKLWEESGVSGRELVSRLIDLAMRRHKRRSALTTAALGVTGFDNVDAKRVNPTI
jgi:D-alanine-D-alanine ligase